MKTQVPVASDGQVNTPLMSAADEDPMMLSCQPNGPVPSLYEPPLKRFSTSFEEFDGDGVDPLARTAFVEKPTATKRADRVKTRALFRMTVALLRMIVSIFKAIRAKLM